MKLIYVDTVKETLVASYPVHDEEGLSRVQLYVRENIAMIGEYTSLKKIMISGGEISVYDWNEEIGLNKAINWAKPTGVKA